MIKLLKNYKYISILLILVDIILISSIILLGVKISILKEKSNYSDNTDNNNNEDNNNKDNDDKNITKNISSIEIVKMPSKIKYKEGELFDKSGMIVKAIYDDNSESFIDNYTIDKINPLTIYDSKIIITYSEKTISFNILIINDEGIEIHPNQSKEKYTLEILEVITRFEIEDSDISNWIISEKENKTKIIENFSASGGKYLSGIDENVQNEGYLIFNLNLICDSEITMSVSYSKNEKWKNYDIDISSMYTFIIDENKEVDIDGNGILNLRDDVAKWQIIKYKSYTLPKGYHTISIISSSNLEMGTPNIDYIDFKSIEIEEIPIEPDSDGKPSNDFHSLLQYKYILDENPANIFNYATGVRDLSRPKGNLLDFSDSIDFSSSSYVIQISSSQDFDSSDTKIIKNLKEKSYKIKNLKLGKIIYYRGAIDEENLLTSKIYKLTINNLPPRNLDIPGVDNSRDIGGYKTTLIENGIIKQGLYYRTAKIHHITEEGKKILTKDLGVKVEIDVREKEKNTGPYVDGVEYHPIPIPTGTKSTRFENFNEEYKKVFSLIAESDKNPVVLHCTAGADRTGIMSFALLTLLGCEYNDVAKDYLFTNFGVQGKREIDSEFNVWWGKLDNFEGETKAEKCKNWLISKGIEASTLEHIRAIFIDGYKENLSLNENNKYSSIITNFNINDLELPDITEGFLSFNTKKHKK